MGFGIELGQWNLQPQAASRIVREYPLDYVLASLHKLNDCDLKQIQYANVECEELLAQYLRQLLLIAEIGDYDCIGHLDLIKRYAAEQGIRIRSECEEWLVRQILRVVVKRGKGIELNTSGLRQSVGEAFPSSEILRWYKAEGGTVITVGSDAHRKQDVGAGLLEAEKLLKKAGFLHISHFRRRRLSQNRIE